MTEQRIRAALGRVGVRDPQEVDREASLYETGVIDSFLLLQLLAALEAEFGIVIHNREVVPENLDSIGRIGTFVARKQAGAE
jgi:acyl carrier protein